MLRLMRYIIDGSDMFEIIQVQDMNLRSDVRRSESHDSLFFVENDVEDVISGRQILVDPARICQSA